MQTPSQSELSAFERKLELSKSVTKRKLPAPKTFAVKPEHFAATWTNVPLEPIALGLRVPSEADVQGARKEAEKKVREADLDTEEEKTQLFNDTLMCVAVASSICDPNDVSAPHPFFDMPDDMVPLAFTPRTIRYIFDSVEVLHIEQSPAFAEIDTVEETKLVDILCSDTPYSGVSDIDAAKARRLLRAALDILEG